MTSGRVVQVNKMVADGLPYEAAYAGAFAQDRAFLHTGDIFIGGLGYGGSAVKEAKKLGLSFRRAAALH